MEELQLPEGVTEEMISEWKTKFKNVSIADLTDPEGNEYGQIILHEPGAFILNEWEKHLDRSPNKAREILINGCLLTRKEEFKTMNKATPAYTACYDACSQLLPIGKASVKKL
jgi:hypothetical protein